MSSCLISISDFDFKLDHDTGKNIDSAREENAGNRTPTQKMPIHRLINKIPIQNENLRIFVGASIFMGLLCVPKAMGGRTFP